MAAPAREQSSLMQATQVMSAAGSFTVCSMGMMVFNKLAVRAFPLACSLVVMQMAFTVVVMATICYKSLHIGSLRDAVRWSMVAPFFSGMLLTSMFALKGAPMSLVITFRSLAPLCSLVVEGFLPNPQRVGAKSVCALMAASGGAYLYAREIQGGSTSMQAIAWIFLNTMLAIVERVLQRSMLSKDQSPVDISKTGCSFLNNLFGMVPMIIAAYVTGEVPKVAGALAALGRLEILWVFLSCVVGVGISFTAIWAQTMISATAMLALTNSNKFVIILLELTLIREAHRISNLQSAGATIAILSSIAYARARQEEEAAEKAAKKKLEAAEKEDPESQPLLGKAKQ